MTLDEVRFPFEASGHAVAHKLETPKQDGQRSSRRRGPLRAQAERDAAGRARADDAVLAGGAARRRALSRRSRAHRAARAGVARRGDVRLHDRRSHAHRRASGQLQVDRSGDGRALSPAGGDAGGLGSSRDERPDVPRRRRLRRSRCAWWRACRRRRACCVPRRPPAGPSSRPRAPFALGAVGSESGAELPRARRHARRRNVAPPRRSCASSPRSAARSSRAGVVRIEHPHIPIQTYLVAADVRLVPVDLAIAGKRIGYIPGPGDEVPASLRQVGYEVTIARRRGAAPPARRRWRASTRSSSACAPSTPTSGCARRTPR